MRVRATNASGGGGGGITAYTKEGNSTDGSMSALPTTASGNITISTGIPKADLKRFRFQGTGATFWVLTDYEVARTGCRQMTVGLMSGTVVNGAAGYADMGTRQTYGSVISNISDDGVVTIQCGSRTTWGIFSYAEWQAG